MNEIKTSTALTSYLSFQLGEEMFAADVSKVLEILELRPITKVPRSPEYMRGVINLRGNVLPVLDTRIKFGLPPTTDTKDTCIIVLNVVMEGEPITLGALVDSVEEVLELGAGDIEPPPSIGSKFNPEYMHGMVKSDERFIMVLNVDKVFSADELVIAQEVADKNSDLAPE
jgi:purine-binding chemotaxis protein CheW